MKTNTIKSFVSITNVPEKLIRACVRQFGGWAYFKESAQDIANHGASGGWSGFTYYSDTIPFAERNLSDILRFANEQAREFGADTAADLIASFNCVDLTKYQVYNALHCYNPRVDDEYDRRQVMNALAWYVLEEVARAYTDALEQQE